MNSILRIAAVSALTIPLGACGTLWCENDAFSSVESSRERARAKVAHFEAGQGLVAAEPGKHAISHRDGRERMAEVQPASSKFVRGGKAAAETRARRTDDTRMAYAEEGRRAVPARATPKRNDDGARTARVPAPPAAVRPAPATPAPAPEVRTAAIVPSAQDEVRRDPSAVPPPATAPRATETQIRDAIFRAWNGVMPTEVSSMALFGVNPYSDGRFADRGARITVPETVIDRRSE